MRFTESARLIERVNESADWNRHGDDSENETSDWDIVNSRDIPEIPDEILQESSGMVPVRQSQGASWATNTATYASAMLLGGVQSTSSIVSSAVASSVASWWRTATGTKPEDGSHS